MFGRFVRAMALVPAAAAMAAFLGFVLGQILGYSHAPTDHKLFEFFQVIQSNFLLIALLSIVVLLLVGAAVERGVAFPR
jgi:ABC-type dipeptide/oligopeptide/nickel transport system permease subunit